MTTVDLSWKLRAQKAEAENAALAQQVEQANHECRLHKEAHCALAQQVEELKKRIIEMEQNDLRDTETAERQLEEMREAANVLIDYCEAHNWGTMPEPFASINPLLKLLGRE